VADAHKPPFRPQAFHISMIITVIHLLGLDALREIRHKTKVIMVTTLLKKRRDLRKNLEAELTRIGKTLSLSSKARDDIYITIIHEDDNSKPALVERRLRII